MPRLYWYLYFVSGVYNLKKFDFDQKTPGVGTIFSWRLRG